ncbi:MAG: hypothetical protein JWO86_7618 [Myxococcaceae bacterium]|nr:hypothetical protein [Myxococcaceae bacterium]
MDGALPADSSDPGAAPPDPPAYVYSATDYRPRQPREIALCEKASSFDWLYTGTMFGGVIGSTLLSVGPLKQSQSPGVRLIGPAALGLFWGGFLSGAWLSLPKCDPLWAEGTPPEGNVRAAWPMAAAISLLAVVTAPAIDYVFLGAVPVEWRVIERSGRVFVAMGTGLLGSLFPYVLSPRPWSAKKQIDRIRLGEVAGGPFVSYGFVF